MVEQENVITWEPSVVISGLGLVLLTKEQVDQCIRERSCGGVTEQIIANAPRNDPR
jgi:hypothetical protein